jgi:cytochrome P450
LTTKPPAPLLIPRETTTECDIGGYEKPAETLVYVNTWSVGLKGQDFELIPFASGRIFKVFLFKKY